MLESSALQPCQCSVPEERTRPLASTVAVLTNPVPLLPDPMHLPGYSASPEAARLQQSGTPHALSLDAPITPRSQLQEALQASSMRLCVDWGTTDPHDGQNFKDSLNGAMLFAASLYSLLSYIGPR